MHALEWLSILTSVHLSRHELDPKGVVPGSAVFLLRAIGDAKWTVPSFPVSLKDPLMTSMPLDI